MNKKFVDIDELNKLRAAAKAGTWASVPVLRGEHVEIHAVDVNRTIAMWLDSDDAKLVVSLVNAWEQIEAELYQLRNVANAAKIHRLAGQSLRDGFKTGMMLDLELSALSRLGDDK